MVQYLSDEWIEHARQALGADPALAESAADAELTIQYEVAGAPGGKRAYALRFDHGAVSLEPGSLPDPSVSFAVDYDTAAAIAQGDLSAQAAFMQGVLKLGGDVTVLIHQHALLGALEDALGELRSDTEF